MTFTPSSGRIRNIYNPASQAPYKISRSKIELFIECSRCFYLDRRLGVSRPEGYPFTLNNAVDQLLKKEFDLSRAKGKAHPLMERYQINAIPFAHKDLNVWRQNFVGIQYLHTPTNFLITGAIDDVWMNPQGELIIVDYKATSTKKEITLDEEYRQSYKRQMEIYQWLFTKNGFKVSDTGYFVYVNGKTDKEAFDAKLEFDVQIIPYTGNNKWVENTIQDIHICLMSDEIPQATPNCQYCSYIKSTQNL